MSRLVIILVLNFLLSQGSRSTSLTDCTCPTDNSTSNAFIFDEEIAQKLKLQVELLNASNDILRLRLEAITTRLDQQTEILNKFSQILSERTDNDNDSDKPPLIDIRAGFSNEQNNQTTSNRPNYPGTCAEAAGFKRRSGIYTIQVPIFVDEPFLVSCDEEEEGGGWTVIQRRVDDRVDFYRDWNSYKIGFGNLEGNFFIGLDKLYALTTAIPQELLVVLTDFDNVTKYAKYDSFAIGDESEMYALKVLGKYSGDAGDSLTFSAGQKFTTKDKQNDIHKNNCAVEFKGAWWYKNCHESNLNGLYLKGAYKKELFAQGVVWNGWRGHYYSLKTVKILIRPKRI